MFCGQMLHTYGSNLPFFLDTHLYNKHGHSLYSIFGKLSMPIKGTIITVDTVSTFVKLLTPVGSLI